MEEQRTREAAERLGVPQTEPEGGLPANPSAAVGWQCTAGHMAWCSLVSWLVRVLTSMGRFPLPVRLSRTTIIAFHDLVIGTIAFWIAVWFGSSFQWHEISWADKAVYTIFVITIVHIVSVMLDSYATVWRHFSIATIRQTLWRNIVTVGGVLGTLFLYDRLVNVSRSAAAFFIILLFLGWLAPRWGYSRWRERGRSLHTMTKPAVRIPVLLVGGGPLALALADWLRRRGGTGGPYPVGFLDEDIPLGRRIGDLPVLGKPADIRRVLGMLRLRGECPRWILVVDDDTGDMSRSLPLLENVARQEGLKLDVAPALSAPPPATVSPAVTTERFGMVPNTWLRLRIIADRVAALWLLVCAAPVILLAALMLRWHLGRPVYFGQWRIGRGCMPFRIIKFRTMRDVIDDCGNVAPAAERLTRLGWWVRKLRIDELLQLWNVVRGEMALIGPRPLVLEDVLEMPEHGRDRFIVPPGVTGWAQVNGGNELTPEEKYAMDIWYIKHASPLLDVRIAWLTVLTMLRGERRDERVIVEALTWYRKHLSSQQLSGTVGEAA